VDKVRSPEYYAGTAEGLQIKAVEADEPDSSPLYVYFSFEFLKDRSLFFA
jgi:hypothetical protein